MVHLSLLVPRISLAEASTEIVTANEALRRDESSRADEKKKENNATRLVGKPFLIRLQLEMFN